MYYFSSIEKSETFRELLEKYKMEEKVNVY